VSWSSGEWKNFALGTVPKKRNPMTKKDYIKAAELIKEFDQHCEIKEIASVMTNIFVKFFRNDNPRFDEKRFRQACKEST
jgi:hypothetical protein